MAAPRWSRADDGIARSEGLAHDWGKVQQDRLFGNGYPPKSAIYQLLSGRSGFSQHLPEVMMDWQLQRFDKAVRTLDHELPVSWCCVWGKHVFEMSERSLGRSLDLNHQRIREHLNLAYAFLLARVSRA